MSKQTDNSLLITSSLSVSRFYQEVLRGVSSYRELGNMLIRKAETAHAFRQFDTVRELGQILFNFPLKEYSSIGMYFIGVAYNSCGNGDQDKAKRMFELVVDSAPDRYKAKAILSLAAVSFNTKDYDSALYFYNETMKVASLDLSSIQAIRTIAIMKGMAGDHYKAVKDLENLCSLIKYAPPHVYFDCWNSLAVEYGEVGRKYEARNIIRHAIASPFASVYLEWQETAQELKEHNRSFISVSHSVPKIERKPVEIETKPLLKPKQERKPANVLPFQKLKEAPEPEEPERVSPTDWDDMTARQRLDFLMTALRTGAISARHYDNIAAQTGMIKAGLASRVMDLEDETVMTDKLIEWAHMIDPDDLAGVISLLRDCDDRIRRVNITDAFIRKFFEYSAACGASEEAWRKKVERRLPKK